MQATKLSVFLTRRPEVPKLESVAIAQEIRGWLFLLLLLLPDDFREMGAWRKTIELQKPRKFSGPGPQFVKRQRVAKERAMQSPQLDSAE